MLCIKGGGGAEKGRTCTGALREEENEEYNNLVYGG